MNKRLLTISLLLVVLVSFISGCASYEGRRAAPFDFGRIGDGFGRGLSRIENFFTGGWQSYERTMVFFIFFFLFYAAYLIGIKKIYKEEKLTRPYMVFAFVAAFLSAFIIAVSVRFDWVNLEYIAWFLLFILVLFLIHSLLLKMGMEKHKFWAFLLALLITALLFWLIWYLMQGGRPLEGLSRAGYWLRGLGKGEGVAGAPGREPGTTPTPGEGDVTSSVTTTGKGWLGRNLLIVLVIIVLIVGGSFSAWRFRGAARRVYRRARINRRLRRRLRDLINDTLRILSDPQITQQERQQVRNNLNNAIQIINQIRQNI